MGWSVSDIPSQTGRTAVVTGAGGLGFETALALARAGGDVVLAGRSLEKGEAAVGQIRAAAPGAAVRFEALDLASLASIKAFAGRLAAERASLDLLVNNAGVMAVPKRRETADGFELQFGTNHLGHFALTAQLAPLLRRSDAPRVVNVSSVAHRNGAMRFEDLQGERRYDPWAAYSQSKLANLLFALELQRRASAAGWGLISNAAHPGYARTELMANGPGGGTEVFGRLFGPLLGQSGAAGALPQLYAAVAPDARGGEYYGPGGWMELKGPPRVAKIMPQGKDEAAARRLWDISEELTGVPFRFGNA
jgi:NAD(P)-dependent dehydrogenase (short-subunit alcohol dehydrogenase family)